MKRSQTGAFRVFHIPDTGEWFTSLPAAKEARSAHLLQPLPLQGYVIDEVTLRPTSRKAQVMALLRGEDVVESRKPVVGPWEPPVVLSVDEGERFGFLGRLQAAEFVADFLGEDRTVAADDLDDLLDKAKEQGIEALLLFQPDVRPAACLVASILPTSSERQ